MRVIVPEQKGGSEQKKPFIEVVTKWVRILVWEQPEWKVAAIIAGTIIILAAMFRG